VSAPRTVPKLLSAYFAGTGLQRQAVARLPRLPCTRLEGEALKTVLGGDLFVGKEARERRLHFTADMAKLSQARVVAFATHGLVSGEVGLGEPGLVLAAPLAGEPDDGLLTTTEIAELRLSADWVLLSACNTASPDASDAEGLSGMSRAFFFAGAKSMMVSHWPIDDVAAQALVTKAVQLREQGMPKAEAIRQASILLMSGQVGPADDSQVHPAAWAPFTLMGEPN
jgi:CHAT domain-containing protein